MCEEVSERRAKIRAPVESRHHRRKEPASMPRVTPITTKEQVVPEHRPIFDAVAEGRGSVRGPFSLMMFSPVFCERVLSLSNFLRFECSVKPKEGELAIIATAREKDCPYVSSCKRTGSASPSSTR